MGDWGHGIFENDAAVDWLLGLIETDTLRTVSEALWQVAVLQRYEYLDDDTASAALASAAIVAALHDGRVDDLHPYARDWVKEHHPPLDLTLRELASQAVKRVAEDSELRDLWSEGGPTNPEWLATVTSLLTRLAT